MMAPWAMQYSNWFEVLNEDMREEIKKEIMNMEEMYGK